MICRTFLTVPGFIPKSSKISWAVALGAICTNLYGFRVVFAAVVLFPALSGKLPSAAPRDIGLPFFWGAAFFVAAFTTAVELGTPLRFMAAAFVCLLGLNVVCIIFSSVCFAVYGDPF